MVSGRDRLSSIALFGKVKTVKMVIVVLKRPIVIFWLLINVSVSEQLGLTETLSSPPRSSSSLRTSTR